MAVEPPEPPEPPEPRSTLPARFVRAILRTVAVYGLLVWAYLAVNSVTHPETMALPLTHFLPWPREGETAVACFVLSAVAFFVLRTGLLDRRPGGRRT